MAGLGVTINSASLSAVRGTGLTGSASAMVAGVPMSAVVQYGGNNSLSLELSASNVPVGEIALAMLPSGVGGVELPPFLLNFIRPIR